jgi:hypothetical protein
MAYNLQGSEDPKPCHLKLGKSAQIFTKVMGATQYLFPLIINNKLAVRSYILK